MSLERLVTEWVRATDQTKRKQLADEVQKVALSEGTYVPWGEWVQPTACRKNVRDILRFAGAWSSTLPSQILPWLVPLLRALMVPPHSRISAHSGNKHLNLTYIGKLNQSTRVDGCYEQRWRGRRLSAARKPASPVSCCTGPLRRSGGGNRLNCAGQLGCHHRLVQSERRRPARGPAACASWRRRSRTCTIRRGSES